MPSMIVRTSAMIAATFEPGRAESGDERDDAKHAVGEQPDGQHLPRTIVLDVVRSRGEERQDSDSDADTAA